MPIHKLTKKIFKLFLYRITDQELYNYFDYDDDDDDDNFIMICNKIMPFSFYIDDYMDSETFQLIDESFNNDDFAIRTDTSDDSSDSSNDSSSDSSSDDNI